MGASQSPLELAVRAKADTCEVDTGDGQGRAMVGASVGRSGEADPRKGDARSVPAKMNTEWLFRRRGKEGRLWARASQSPCGASQACCVREADTDMVEVDCARPDCSKHNRYGQYLQEKVDSLPMLLSMGEWCTVVARRRCNLAEAERLTPGRAMRGACQRAERKRGATVGAKLCVCLRRAV